MWAPGLREDGENPWQVSRGRHPLCFVIFHFTSLHPAPVDHSPETAEGWKSWKSLSPNQMKFSNPEQLPAALMVFVIAVLLAESSLSNFTKGAFESSSRRWGCTAAGRAPVGYEEGLPSVGAAGVDESERRAAVGGDLLSSELAQKSASAATRP